MGLIGVFPLVLGIYMLAQGDNFHFGIWLTAGGAALFVVALGFLTTRSSVELGPCRITLIEWVGPIPFRRVRPLRHLRRFAIHRLQEGRWTDPQHDGVLEVACEGSQTLWFAAGYSCELLESLARELAQRCGVPLVGSPDEDAPRVKIEPLFISAVRDEDTFDRVEQPPGSRITVERLPDGLSVLRIPPVEVPPLQVLPWVIFLAVVGWFIARLLLPWPVALLVLGVILGAVVAYVFHVCKRWTIVAASREVLSILTTGGLLKPREEHWPSTEITAVRIGPTSARRDGPSACELQIHFIGGKKVSLFSGRDKDELAWLATVLRQELHVPPVASAVLAG
jgi:hypothetical protein